MLTLTALSGCQHQNSAPLDTGEPISTLPTTPDMVCDFGNNRLASVYFDYNSYSLRPDALTTLKANAELIKRNKDALIQIEGHCDERGTQEYNLTLGEKRALATRNYLISLGVAAERLPIVSYGEEDPVDTTHTEAARAKNRRCEFNKAL